MSPRAALSHQPSPQQPNAARANPPTQQPTMQTKRCNAKFYVGMVESHRQAAMQCAAVSSCLLELDAPLYKPLEGSSSAAQTFMPTAHRPGLIYLQAPSPLTAGGRSQKTQNRPPSRHQLLRATQALQGGWVGTKENQWYEHGHSSQMSTEHINQMFGTSCTTFQSTWNQRNKPDEQQQTTHCTRA